MPLWPDAIEEERYVEAYKALHLDGGPRSLTDAITQRYRSVVELVDSGTITNPRLAGLPAQEVFVRWFDHWWKDAILYAGYHESLATGDWSAFLDAQFTSNRLVYQYDTRAHLSVENRTGSWDPDFDGTAFVPGVLHALSGCDIALARAYLPVEEGLNTASAHPFVVLVNLLMCVLHRRVDWYETSLKRAEKAANRKSTTILVRASLEFLSAVLRADTDTASVQLQTAIDGFRKADWLHDYRHPLSKFCPRWVYGLYIAAQQFLDADAFLRIAQPRHLLWRSDYTAHCARNAYAPGGNRVAWCDELSFLEEELGDLARWKRMGASGLRAEA